MGRIIFADDDDVVAEVVCDAFMAAGHAVGWLSDGRNAYEVICRRPPDLVILDCSMPEMTGVQIVREMRKSAALCDIPVLMLTGRVGDSDEGIARYEGANDYVKKPFDPRLLVARAEALMRGERRWD
ncbi:response regulator transcription factor [Sphingomonas sp. PAMC 26621]|uniref:response regulator transcription factor n=1 Tax=Sphingomonas sp. PAMC 26621 TaxID=1112213 RepID=UPI000308D8FF|nr:response regulator [Sphingomonas sp. PAMC 26621]